VAVLHLVSLKPLESLSGLIAIEYVGCIFIKVTQTHCLSSFSFALFQQLGTLCLCRIADLTISLALEVCQSMPYFQEIAGEFCHLLPFLEL